MTDLTGEHAVTAIIPAYNAEATLDETLRSVRGQTHRALEILVVDDGSRDRTAAIAVAHAAEDSRVRLIRQHNAGVAAARNHGIREARTGLVAPVDADDLWAPTKIERQVAALQRGGPRVALVYTWSALIDRQSHVTGFGGQEMEEGDVMARLCRGNLIGNGSAALMRRDAVLAAGGFDPTLRARGAQGCEDWLLYCRIAAHHHAAVVPDFLTGYRQVEASMSRDVVQMVRSWQIVTAELRERHPAMQADIEAGEAFAARWLLGRALWAGEFNGALRVACTLVPDRHLRVRTAMAGELVRFATAVMKGRVRRIVGHVPKRTSPPRQRFPVGAISAKAPCG